MDRNTDSYDYPGSNNSAGRNTPRPPEWLSPDGIGNIPPPAAGAPPPPAPDSSGSYRRWTRYPVVYLPVMLSGTLIGYLYASPGRDSAGFQYRTAANVDKLECIEFWHARLTENYRHRLTPEQAIRSWIGVAEDPRGGGVPVHAQERTAQSIQALWEALNPHEQPLGEGPWIQDGESPDGTPVDRSNGWGPIVSAKRPNYEQDTRSSVRYFPIVLDGMRTGYVWASSSESAAGYIPMRSAGEPALIASGTWVFRFSQGYAAGWTALDSLRYCRRFGYDSMAGQVDPVSPELEAQNLVELKRLAGY